MLSAAVTLATFLIIGQYLDFDEFMTLSQTTNPAWFIPALVVFLVNYLLRAIRFRLLIYSASPSQVKIFGTTALHGMLNYLLPAKLGELVYPFLARSRLGLSLSEGAATLIVARFWDFAVVILLLPVTAFYFADQLQSWALLSIVCVAILVSGLFGVVFWLVNHHQVINLNVEHSSTAMRRALTAMSQLTTALRSIHGKKNHVSIALLTCGIWSCIYVNFYFLVLALGFETTLFEMAVVSVLLMPLTLIPTQGLANIGTHELGWVTGLSLFGHPLHDSLQIAVGTHTLLLSFVLILGATGLACLHSAKRTPLSHDTQVTEPVKPPQGREG